MLPNGPYKPNKTEEKILDFWLQNKFYKPEYNAETGELDERVPEGAKTYAVTMPPPNANGDLHLGHVSGYSYQDLMGRYQRMRGKRVLLLPGKDHAGIQTEVVYEKLLDKKGTSKQELGRDEFYKQVYDFCIQNAENARRQEQRIGTSADFDRELFTLDPKIVDDVLKTFIMMHEEGMIYRGKRLINWCPRCHSALADIDTEYKDSKSMFFYFKYAFTEPEEKALELKREYEGKEQIEWTFERQLTKNKETKMPFAYGHIEHHDKELEVMGFGYGELEEKTQNLTGKPIGVQMRLDGKFRLVVAKEGADKEEIKSKIGESFLFEIGYYAGAHIILFAEYPEDKYYTNGFVMGTVRPETMFGDTALAVSPKDERYADYVGKSFKVQTLTGVQEMPIVADNAVDPEFGAGMLKVTPAHAVEDWDIAQRNPDVAMPEKQVIDFDGKLNHMTGDYSGMSVNAARRQLAEDMRASGMLIHLNEEYENRVQVCERCKSRIEPLISHQWFVRTAELKAKAKKLVEEDLVNIMPEGRENVYLQWMDSPEDWCITRQLWWGYRIPVWYKGEKSEYVTETGEVKEKIGDVLIEKHEDYAKVMQVGLDEPTGKEWQQDPDVLDTWFSSGQWPFVTLNAREGDLETFYPTQTMETGWDILIFWVTRMMMLSTYRADKLGLADEQQAPFSNVYLHGLVLDKDGQKMSKSKGNGIDPSATIEKYGADALRFSFVAGNSAGQNARLYEEKVASNGRFMNKIWNASKFVMMNLEGVDVEKAIKLKREDLTIDTNLELFDHIVELKETITRLYDTFQFGVAGQLLFENFWHSFADQHIEAAKPHVYTFKDRETGEITSEPEAGEKAETQLVLWFALHEYLKMLHPIVPFITEEIWQHLEKPASAGKTLMWTKW